MKNSLNLLPWRFRRRLLFRIRLIQWMTVWGICVILVGLAAFAKFRYILVERSMLQSEKQKYLTLIQKKHQNSNLKIQLHTLRRQLNLLEDFESKQVPLNLVGLVSQSAEKSDHRIQVEDLSFTRTQLKAAEKISTPNNRSGSNNAKKSPEETEEEIKLVLKGTAEDDLAVARFIVSLRDCGVFDRVELKSSIGEEIEGTKIRRYQLECTF